MKPVLYAAVAALAVTTPVFAQGVPSHGGHDPAPGATGAYVGASKEVFYTIEQRITAAEARARSTNNRGVLSSLRQLRAFINQQIARHGEIRDWDREAIVARLTSAERRLG